ncbi:conserved hypothetical protein [Flavobacterium sp. 9AF]|uniref:hypothetical protein n=1 Tax=Flavobacterium sp. 9AF TaxID=2653142 RepID=UPI0012F1AFA0|nr:hypothetical protein [Flavobacterium sp. 9AF]VXA91410.1 conserved hypothetical protein [Flavobacterium sp. 9AF]
MTFRIYIQCEDCNEQYMVRYGLGNKFPQEASFQCQNCTKQITVGYFEYGSDLTCKGARSIDEAQLKKDKEPTVQNLHPELPIDKSSASDPTHFQVLYDIDKILKNSNEHEFRLAQAQLVEFENSWKELEPSFRILVNVSEEKLKDVFNKEPKEFYSEFYEWAMLFLSGKWGEKSQNFIDYAQLHLSAHLIEYVKQNKTNLLHKIFDICTTYMNGYSDFQRTILLQKLDSKHNNDVNTNVNWNNISKVYGDLYELVGDLFLIPTMLNNLEQGRNFDGFNSVGFTLDKYLASDKANRAVNFETNSESSFLKNYFFAWLRNGTHHKNCKLVNGGEEIELGTGKGGKNIKNIPLVEYLESCNNLFASGLTISLVIIKILKENT